MSEELAAIVARIDARLDQIGMSDRQASLEATGVAHTIRNMRRGSKPAVDQIAKLANVLQTTAGFLAFGETEEGEALAPTPGAANANLPLIGKVAAGAWLEVDSDVDAPLYTDLPIPADPDYPAEWQFVVEVSGTSVNRVAPDGAFLRCLDTHKARRAPMRGDLVIVEQRRGGGHEIMRTAKRYHPLGDTIELRPDSDDPRWQKPMVIRPGEEEEGTTIRVIGIVTAMHATMQHLDRSRR